MSTVSTPLTPRRSDRKHVKKQVVDYRLRNWVIKFRFGVVDNLFTDFSLHIEGERTDTYEYWTTSAVTAVDLPCYVKTSGGTVYYLEGGPSNMLMAGEGYPPRLIKFFSDGFHEDWMNICRRFVAALKKMAPQAFPKAQEYSRMTVKHVSSESKTSRKKNLILSPSSSSPKRSPVKKTLSFIRSSVQKVRRHLSPKKIGHDIDISTPKKGSVKRFSPKKTIQKAYRSLHSSKTPSKRLKKSFVEGDISLDVQDTPSTSRTPAKKDICHDTTLVDTPCNGVSTPATGKKERRKCWRLEQTQLLKTALSLFHPKSDDDWKHVAETLNDKFTIEECRKKAETQFKYTVKKDEELDPKTFFELEEKIKNCKPGTLKHYEAKAEITAFVSKLAISYKNKELKKFYEEDSMSDEDGGMFTMDVIAAAKKVRPQIDEVSMKTTSKRQYFPIPMTMRRESLMEIDRQLDEEFAVPDWSNRPKIQFRLRNHRRPTKKQPKEKPEDEDLMNDFSF